jgi:hypothetical protein
MTTIHPSTLKLHVKLSPERKPDRPGKEIRQLLAILLCEFAKEGMISTLLSTVLSTHT